MMEADTFQTLINVVFGVGAFLGGWLIKITFNQLTTLRRDYDELYDQAREDYRGLSERVHALALSMPEKYVAKADLDKLIEHFNDRFDKLEIKLDNLPSKK